MKEMHYAAVVCSDNWLWNYLVMLLREIGWVSFPAYLVEWMYLMSFLLLLFFMVVVTSFFLVSVPILYSLQSIGNHFFHMWDPVNYRWKEYRLILCNMRAFQKREGMTTCNVLWRDLNGRKPLREFHLLPTYDIIRIVCCRSLPLHSAKI